MIVTVQQHSTDSKSILPAHYAQAASWLQYHEWKRLVERVRVRALSLPTKPRPNFTEELAKADLSPSCKFTLTVMHDLSGKDGRLQVSKAFLANLIGASESTIKRQWRQAEQAGFLTRYDYPLHEKRPSDMWLWAGDAPTELVRDWDKYDTGEMVDSPEPFTGW